MKKLDAINIQCLAAAVLLTLFLTFFQLYPYDIEVYGGELHLIVGVKVLYLGYKELCCLPFILSLQAIHNIMCVYAILRLIVPVIMVILFVRAANHIRELEKKQIVCCSVLSLLAVFLNMFYYWEFGNTDENPILKFICIALFILSLLYYIYLTIYVLKRRMYPEM